METQKYEEKSTKLNDEVTKLSRDLTFKVLVNKLKYNLDNELNVKYNVDGISLSSYNYSSESSR